MSSASVNCAAIEGEAISSSSSLLCRRESLAVARAILRRSTPINHYLLVGDRAACEQAQRKIEESHGVDATVVAAMRLDQVTDDDLASEVLASFVDRDDVHRVVIAPGATDQGDVLDLVRAAKAQGLKVSLLPRMFEVVGSSVVFDDVEGSRCSASAASA